MRVHHVSDLHVNHHVPFNQNQLKWELQTKAWVEQLFARQTGDVLVLNGDFSEWNQQSLWVVEVAAQHFKKVFVTVGNHDYYLLSKTQRKKYGTSFNRVEEFLSMAEATPNVTALHQRVVEHNGVVFAGDPMWYPVLTEKDRDFYLNRSNDSRFIHTGMPFKENWEVLHDLSMDWYHSLAGQSVDVFVSHVPPVTPAMVKRPQSCYVTEVPFFVGEHWVAGHQHVNRTFKRSGVTFHMNPLGYPDELVGVEPELMHFTVTPSHEKVNPS